MRLIDADKLKEIKWDKKNGNSHFLNGVDTVMEVIDNLPTVDGKVHAHWEDKKGREYCSACGKEKFDGLYADVYESWDIPCCPHCGAKMIEEEK